MIMKQKKNFLTFSSSTLNEIGGIVAILIQRWLTSPPIIIMILMTNNYVNNEFYYESKIKMRRIRPLCFEIKIANNRGENAMSLDVTDFETRGLT